MELLTNTLKTLLQKYPLYSQDGKSGEAVACLKFFCILSDWTWYVLEYDGKDTFFGIVVGLEVEYGYFSLSELENTSSELVKQYGLGIERDLLFSPKTLDEAVRHDSRLCEFLQGIED